MSYAANQDLRYLNKQPVSIICDKCGGAFSMLYKSAEKHRKRHGCHVCPECSGCPRKPQNTSAYWTDERRMKIGEAIKNSDRYRAAIKQRDVSGERNPMFGRTASEATRKRMSDSRKGKIGSNATAWRGGKSSVTKRVKGIVHGRHDWYGRVFRRDGWKCTICGNKTKLDAHHIEPINQIIKRLCEGLSFANDDEKVTWLAEQPEIIDLELKNGVTLCRECHKLEHKNWGSHECR